MTDVDYERVAVDFLGVPPRGSAIGVIRLGQQWFWDDWSGSKVVQRSIPAPGPSWSFFGACWEECKRRGWSGLMFMSGSRVALYTDRAKNSSVDAEADPLVALPACIIKVLDAQGGTPIPMPPLPEGE